MSTYPIREDEPTPRLRLIDPKATYDGRRRMNPDEKALVVLPQMAAKIGLEEAIFVQQVYYWTSGPNAQMRDGYRWVYNSLDAWLEQFPFWKRSHLHRVIQSCIQQGIIVSGEYNSRAADRTRWYRVNEDHPAVCLAPSQIPNPGYGEPAEQPGNEKTAQPSQIPNPGYGTSISHQRDIHVPDLGQHYQDTTPDTTQEKKHPPTPRRGKVDVDERFDEFWRAYPRKEAKQAARKAWAKLKPDAALVDTMLRAIARQRVSAQWQKDGGQFIPHAATWLNQGRWEDELGGPAKEPGIADRLRAYGSAARRTEAQP